MSDYLNELNEVQRRAALHNKGAALVIAVPGAGKTRVLTYRIAQLLQQGVSPDNILALTFTNKAAREMKERIQKIAGNNAGRIWAGTFHSVFARILRQEAHLLGYPSDFSIYDSSDAKSAISEIVKTNNLDGKTYTANTLYFRISNAKNSLISPQKYAMNPDLRKRDNAQEVPHTHAIYNAYVNKCRKAGAMDFDDLLYQMHELLYHNPEGVLERYRQKFKYVLVDEFQDTNPLQYGIIQLLVKYPGSENNIFVVGDDAQSIYGFRGATIQNILDFERDYPELKIFKLEQNYRSTNFITQAANDVIAHNSRQFKKNIQAQKEGGQPIRVIRAVDDTEEAKKVIQTLIELRHRYQLHYEDFAILYRTNAQSRAFEEELQRQRIPYKVYGGTSFYDRKEVKDMIAYLRAVVNPQDEEAVKRIINYPTRGIGDKTISEIIEEANKRGVSLWEMLKKAHETPNIGQRAVPYLRNFVLLIESFRVRMLQDNAHEIALYIAKHSTLQDELRQDKTTEGQERVENLQALLDSIKSFVDNDELIQNDTAIPDKSLSTYLQNVALLSDMDDKQAEQTDRVKLMSVHSAKGLEFPAVFVVGMEENLFPSMMALKSDNAREGLDEERRLFYVAITRAEAHLTLSYASSRYRFGKMTYNNTSRFIDEIKPQWLDLPQHTRTNAGISTVRGKGIPSAYNPSPANNTPNPPSNHKGLVFKPADAQKVVAGTRLVHEKFGEGKVIAVDGAGDNKIAQILFSGDIGEKRIVVKFARIAFI